MMKYYKFRKAFFDLSDNMLRSFRFGSGVLLLLLMLSSFSGWGQTTIVNYDFNSGTSDATLTPVLATDISAVFSCTEGWITYTGTTSGSQAFTFNPTAGVARGMANSSGTNTRYYQVQIGGSALNTYTGFKVYMQAQRSSTGAQVITLAYSTNGSDYTNFATTMSPGNGSFAQNVFDLSAITTIDNPTALYIRLLASGASGTGTLRLDNLQVQGTQGGVATLVAAPTSLTNFQYIVGSGPSASQSYNLSGSYLTGFPGNIVVTGSTNYEVSTDDLNFYGSVNVPYNSADLSSTPIYVRLIAGLAIGAYNLENILNAGGGASTVNVTCSGSVVGPTLYVSPSSLSNFHYSLGSGPSPSQSYNLSGANLVGYPGNITVTGPADYEVSLDNSDFQSSVAVPFTSATLSSTPIYVRLIAGLSVGTYNSENVSNTGGGATSVNVTCNGYVQEESATYSWIGGDNGDWTVSTNWNPARTTPNDGDILQFNSGTADSVVNVPTATIAKLIVSNNTTIYLKSGTTATLTIAGGAGSDLEITSGSSLNILQTNAIIITLSVGATGSISGTMTFGKAAHRLLAASAGGVTFQNGSAFTAGTAFSGNAFGTTSLNSIIFANGATYIHVAGSNPFGASQPNTVVNFQAGSLYKAVTNSTPAFSGRTYANFELDAPGQTVSPSGTAAVVMDNLTVTNGTLNFNMTATPGHSIKGNITVASGGVLNFAPASAGTVNLNGTAAQIISGSGTINSTTTSSTIAIANSNGVTLQTSATLYNLTVSSGTFTVASGASLITKGTVTGNVTVERQILGWTGDSHGWHLLSSPVASQAINPAFTDPIPANYDFYKWDEVSNVWLNQKVAGNNITTFSPGTGYLVAYQNSSTKSFAGIINNGNVTVNNLTLSGGTYSGWNLLGNPFTSAIKWNDGVNWTVPADFAANAKVWNEATAAYVDISSNGIIPRSNGFMVQVLSGSPASMTIPTAARLHDNTPFYKESGDILKLVAYDRTGNTAQECVIGANDQATGGYDRDFDSRFLAGYAPKFYALAGGEMLSTHIVPALNTASAIDLGFEKNGQTEFSIGLENAIPGLTVYLTDKKTGITTELKDGVEYSFISQEGDEPNRFLLHFSPLSIEDPGNVNPFEVYSTGDQIRILSHAEGESELYVTNLVGQVVLAGRAGEGMTTVNAASLTNGVYLVNLASSKGIVSHKVIINK